LEVLVVMKVLESAIISCEQLHFIGLMKSLLKPLPL